MQYTGHAAAVRPLRRRLRRRQREVIKGCLLAVVVVGIVALGVREFLAYRASKAVKQVYVPPQELDLDDLQRVLIRSRESMPDSPVLNWIGLDEAKLSDMEAQQFLDQATSLFDANNLTGADQITAKLRQATPRLPGLAEQQQRIHIRLLENANKLYQAHDYRGAEAVALRLKQANPGLPGVSNLLALIYKNQRKWEQALVEYEQALKVKPDSPQIHYGMAVIYSEIKKDDLAESHFKEAYKLDPISEVVIIDLVDHLRKRKRFNEALGYLDAGLAANPSDSALKLTRTVTLIDLGEYDKAEGYVRKDLAANADDPQALLSMATLHARRGNAHEAVRWLQAYELRSSKREVRLILEHTTSFDQIKATPLCLDYLKSLGE